MEQLLELLKTSGADDYQIDVTKTDSHEFFFIRRQLDQNRKKSVEHKRVTVYKKIDEHTLGSATVEIAAGSTEKEIRDKLETAILAASYVKNPIYALEVGTTPKQRLLNVDALQIARNFIETLMSIEETESEWINSAEIFVNVTRCHKINSRGIDVLYDKVDAEAEVIVNAKNGTHEIELYRDFTMGTCDSSALLQQLKEAMKVGKDRCLAKPTPKLGKMTVLFSGADTAQFANYLIGMANASAKYQKISTWELNEPISKLPIKGDSVTLNALRELPNSSANQPFDGDGKEVVERTLIENGRFCSFFGNSRFCQYIDFAPSGMAYNFALTGGTKKESELRTAPYLEAVEFSDFQVDMTTGDFAGEIRLAYYFDGHTTTIVTGGSLSGSMKDALANWTFTQETRQLDHLILPKIIAVPSVSITGIQ